MQQTSKHFRWKTPKRLSDGHRLFQEDPMGNVPAGRFAVADDSGFYPHMTDDGVLWLDMTRALSVGKDQSVDPPHEHLSIPLTHEDGTRTRTPTDAATLLYLAARFRWSIEDHNVGISYKVV